MILIYRCIADAILRSAFDDCGVVDPDVAHGRILKVLTQGTDSDAVAAYAGDVADSL